MARLDDLYAALEEAPLVPEHRIERIVNNEAFVATRWDTSDYAQRRRLKDRGTLAPKQLERLQRLANGELVTQIAPGDRANFYKSMRMAQARLGAATLHQAIAIAVNLGLVTVEQEYAIGPKFVISGQACRKDRHPLPPSLRPVLVGACNGYSDEEIAAIRGVSPNTVKSQMKRLRVLYGVRSRAHLAAVAVRAGHVY